MKKLLVLNTQKKQDFINVNGYNFQSYIFTPRFKPKKSRIILVGCFSEFGCETIGAMYCIPKIIRRFPGRYFIGVGWYGREYMYRHIVDEFWEIDEKYMYLRETVNAFKHSSEELKKIEESLIEYGGVINTAYLARYAVGNMCNSCGFYWTSSKVVKNCSVCKGTDIQRSPFSTPLEAKKSVVKIPKPKNAMEWAKSIILENTVGIFARGRNKYGRNLSQSFYKSLINLLRDKGYNVIWLGEKQSVQPCPVEDVLDFSRMTESRDLDKTLAIISQLKFTVQFWTASTRLAGIMGVPFLLFESPDQIYHVEAESINYAGQEGLRLELTSFGDKKLVISDYKPTAENEMIALDYVDYAIDQMNNGNYNDIIAIVEDMEKVLKAKEIYYSRVFNAESS